MTAFDNERAAGRPGVPDEPDRPERRRADGVETLRDRFAMAALTAIIAKHPAIEVPVGTERQYVERYASGAYAYADAMMAQRERR